MNHPGLAAQLLDAVQRVRIRDSGKDKLCARERDQAARDVGAPALANLAEILRHGEQYDISAASL